MLSGITWEDFITGTGLLAISYYILVMILYYRADIKEILMKKTRQGIGPISMVTDKHAKNSFSRVDELEKVVSNIRGSILEKAGKDVSKAELLKELKVKLTNYEGLHQPACRVAITNFMIKETKELCGVVLSEEELESVWETLLR